MCSPVFTIYFHCPDVARALCGRAYFTVLGHINPASPAPAKSRLAVSPRLCRKIKNQDNCLYADMCIMTNVELSISQILFSKDVLSRPESDTAPLQSGAIHVYIHLF